MRLSEKARTWSPALTCGRDTFALGPNVHPTWLPACRDYSKSCPRPNSVALSSPLCPSRRYHRPTSASHLSPLGHHLGIGRSDHTTTEDENPASGFGNCHRWTFRVNPIDYCATVCSSYPRAVSLEFIGDAMCRGVFPAPDISGMAPKAWRSCWVETIEAAQQLFKE